MEGNDPQQGSCRGNLQDPRQGPCRGQQRATPRPLPGHPARPSRSTPVGPPPGPHKPSHCRRSHAAADPTSWAGTCVATCNPLWRLHHCTTSAACLPTWHRMHRWPGRVSKQRGAATDGTGLTPVPDKAGAHLSYALNVSCPVIRAISSGHYAPFHLLCATVAAPFAYKRRTMAHKGGIRLLETRQPP